MAQATAPFLDSTTPTTGRARRLVPNGYLS